MTEIRTYVFYLYRWSESRPQQHIFNDETCDRIGFPYRCTDVDFKYILSIINSKLRNCLRMKKISHFVPLKRPSVEISYTGTVSVIYYHNDDLHNTIFNSRPGMVLMPAGELLSQLNSMLIDHGLEGWGDPRAMVLGLIKAPDDNTKPAEANRR